MAHADDAVGALHAGEMPEGPHDVRTEGRKRAVPERAVEGQAGLFDPEVDALTAEAGRPHPDLKRLAGSLAQGGWMFQPPRAAVGDHLEGRGAASPGIGVEGGNQGQGLPGPILVLQIPAFKIGGRRCGAAERTHNLSPRVQFCRDGRIL